jgi:hypothetical protein
VFSDSAELFFPCQTLNVRKIRSASEPNPQPVLRIRIRDLTDHWIRDPDLR